MASIEEIEVYDAVARYKIALIKTDYRSLEHRLLCKIKNRKALFYDAELEIAYEDCREVINKTPYHIAILIKIIQDQPSFIQGRDRLIELVS